MNAPLMPAQRTANSRPQTLVLLQVTLDGGVDFAVEAPIDHDQTARAHQQFLERFERLVEDGLQGKCGNVAKVAANAVRANAREEPNQSAQGVVPQLGWQPLEGFWRVDV